ncbi:MAG: 3-hydroxyacyl-CoA dehydrogenase NAD-binding domain-containing protein [Gemmataceae bacterium]|nr:3-hydroxyacyl-CoA dehydrogenase NAD-binding domain-containing protein [Gemmata sp.]MDW8196854.1 3-hydroxyacyl-CoA dehydrogenase NAD-binding domain-containing protein [Gemmataceae bacterium]
MSELVLTSTAGDIGIITVNNPPVNALSPAVAEALRQAVQQFVADPSVRGLVLIGAGRTFIAGADIKEFAKVTATTRDFETGIDPLLAALEDSPKPVVCAIHGTALGGGLETAMACHYRIATPDAQLGQPEVKIGLIPGAGGTQRLPRLVGVAKALEMCAGGEPIRAPDALACGLLDALAEGELLPAALAYCHKCLAAGTPPRRTRDLHDKLGTPAVNAPLLAFARAQAQKRAKHLIAPAKAIDAVEAATTLPFAEGCARERQLFLECLFSDQAKALIHVFLAEREAAKVPGVGPDTPRRPIRRAAIVGAGTMGCGIAMVYANAGIPVWLQDVDAAALERGMATIRKNYATTVQKGKLTPQQRDERLARIEPTHRYERFAEADIVVEAVFENLALKKQVFAELDQVAHPEAILATNTSSLSIDAIAAATRRPQQVIGHHFFSPAHVMKLLEIVRGKETSLSVVATSIDLAKRLGKVGVVVGNCRAFVGNRMFEPYVREAQFLLEEGATIDQVDGALTEFGLAMGPLAVLDLAGLDIGWRMRQEQPPPVTGRKPFLAEDQLCAHGQFGQKTGAGWYRYGADRVGTPNPDAIRFVAEAARANGITPRAITAQEIVERTIFALINEGARILEEGIALRPGDIDIISIYGYGFPAWRGGPLWYADTLGLRTVYERISAFEKQHGAWWSPAPLLQRLASAGRTFASLTATPA